MTTLDAMTTFDTIANRAYSNAANELDASQIAGFALFNISEELTLLLDRRARDWTEHPPELLRTYATRLAQLYVEMRLLLGTPAKRICEPWHPRHDNAPDMRTLRQKIKNGEEIPADVWLAAFQHLTNGDRAEAK